MNSLVNLISKTCIRFQLLDESVPRMDKEGLNTINYTPKSVIRKNLFTHIIVDYDQNEILHAYFNKSSTVKR